MSKGKTGLLFILMGMISLWAGLIFGSIGAFQFVYPELFEFLPFFKSRPLHVSLVVAWIFLTAVGGVYYYLPKYSGVALYSDRLPKWHLGIFLATGLAVLGSYLLGKFGGREYWEFPPVLAIPILFSWVLLGINYVKTVFKVKNWPVYYYENIEGGHGGASDSRQEAFMTSLSYDFMWRALMNSLPKKE